MATRFLQLVCMSCYSCIILHGSSLQGVAGDVPDDAVYTDLHKNIRIGDNVSLLCQFRGAPSAVYWKKIDDPKVTLLFSWKRGDPVTGICEDERPCEIMEMNANRSLVIKEVSIADHGEYMCRVVNYKGKWIQNYTEIRVFSPPKEPYPTINECLRSPDKSSNQTCVISTAEDSINISCTVLGYFPDLDLFFLRGPQNITTLHLEETTNEDKKKNKTITVHASPSPEPYVCVASGIPGVAGQSEASLLVTSATGISVDRVYKVGALLFIIVLAVAVGASILWCKRQQEPISYLELRKLVDDSDQATGNDIVSTLFGNAEKNLGKEELYTRLCEGKERSSVNVRSIDIAMKKRGFHDARQALKDFRACTSVRVADDDLAHICSQVRSCEEETINPILRALYREGSCPILSTYKSLEDDLNMMKRWKSSPVSERVTYCSRSEEVSIQLPQDDEMTPMNPGSGEVHPKVKTAPPNQLIRLCLALEEAGKRVEKRHRPLYFQLAKTFFKDVPTNPGEIEPFIAPQCQATTEEKQCPQLSLSEDATPLIYTPRATASTFPPETRVQLSEKQGHDMTWSCNKHFEELKLYCIQHDILICHLCATKDHTQEPCKLVDIADVTLVRKRKLKDEHHEIEKTKQIDSSATSARIHRQTINDEDDEKKEIRLINEEADEEIRIINENRDRRIKKCKANYACNLNVQD